MFREGVIVTSEHPIIHQVFLILLIYMLFNVIVVRGNNIISAILCW